MRKAGKSASPCEVCGERCNHEGKEKGFVVGYTTKGVKRLVHMKCRRNWAVQGRDLMSKWIELRPDVLPTLPKYLQASIRRCLATFEGEHMPRRRSPDAFHPSPELINWVREQMLNIPMGKQVPYLQLLTTLAAEHPDWVSHNGQVIAPHVFYAHFSKVRVQTDTERKMLPSTSRMPTPPAFPALSGPPDPSKLEPLPPPETLPVVPVSTEPALARSTVLDDDLDAMAETAHALVNLAHRRHDRASIQFTLEVFAHLLQPPKTSQP